MRIVSWNVNGLRAILKKGFLDWLERERPDVLCLQEVKATESQLAEADCERIRALGYSSAWHTGTRGGYSGVATYCLAEPLFVSRGVPFERGEGRVITTEHGDFTLYNVYFPNGRQREDGPDPERLAFKLEFYRALLAVLEEERAEGKSLVVCGDWNTAHTELDIARPKENEKVTGFLPQERAALQEYFDRGFCDAYRYLHPASSARLLRPEDREYSWWTYRAGARERNIGWRIDYHLLGPELVPALADARIWSHVTGSDHCPVVLDLKL